MTTEFTAALEPTPEQVAAHEAGYEANYEGVALHRNPHPAASALYRAWESGHLQAQDARNECRASDDDVN